MMRRRPRWMSIACLILLSMTGCGSSSGVQTGVAQPSECAWLKPVTLDPGYEARLTDAEKKQILAMDLNIQKICGLF